MAKYLPEGQVAKKLNCTTSQVFDVAKRLGIGRWIAVGKGRGFTDAEIAMIADEISAQKEATQAEDELIGRTGYVVFPNHSRDLGSNGMRFAVKVLSVQRAYGRFLATVKPVSGHGRQRIPLTRIEWELPK